MLNLSDKELDRLSREAAQEHDPGDVLGSGSWDKLEPRLDTDLGKTGSSPLRGVRRFPFYYAPAAILLVAGVIFFTLQNHRSGQNKPFGSPPTATGSATQSISLPQNSEHSTNSTPSASPSATADSTAIAPGAAATGAANPSSVGGTQNDATTTTRSSGTTPSTSPTATTGSTTTGESTIVGSTTGTSKTSGNKKTTGSTTRNHAPTYGPLSAAANTRTRNHKPGRNRRNLTTANTTADNNATSDQSSAGINTTTNPSTTGSTNNPSKPPTTTAPRELTYASLPKPRRLQQRTAISDSALRAYTAKTSTIQIGKSKSLRINRTLQFGLSLAPDFSSVNSLAGDKPGSTIGLTLDYQFANHWYLSTGLLLDRKNYAARAQDYHVPYDYYRANGIHNVDFVKGSFSMLEIPINLRYDFSVTGNTLFFASAGLSSYLMTNENCNYYFNAFGPGTDNKSFNYSNNSSYLFSTINLSLGVETGISDDLSLLVSPYIKLPAQNIGFGQISMSSVGVTFALKFAPVISKRRK
jgi:hypothetical protein